MKEFWIVYILSVPNGVFYYFIRKEHTTTIATQIPFPPRAIEHGKDTSRMTYVTH